MTPTRPRTLLLVAAAAGVVTWAVLTAVYASLPPLTWTLVPALLIAAGIETWTGRDLRARIQGHGNAKPAPPLFVARIVALAKASSQTAALLAGACAGFMVYLSGLTSAPTPRADLVNASLSFGASLILLAAALYLEYCCRVPKDPGDRDPDPTPPPPSPFNHGR
jgi:DMSO reductase anchor subunit